MSYDRFNIYFLYGGGEGRTKNVRILIMFTTTKILPLYENMVLGEFLTRSPIIQGALTMAGQHAL